MAATALNTELAAVKLGYDIHGKCHLRLFDNYRLDPTPGTPSFQLFLCHWFTSHDEPLSSITQKNESSNNKLQDTAR